jgi:L-threonylcarbamoyladenylate synthase
LKGEIVAMPAALEPETLARILASVKSGGVLAVPTDTLYGLAADPASEVGVGRIYALKGRSAAQALPVVVGSTEQLEALGVRIGAKLFEKLRAIWPAPLTAVLPLARGIAASGGVPTLAVRVPAHPELRALLDRVGPLTATSANRSGGEPARSAADVSRIFDAGIDFVLDGGPSASPVPSTIVDFTKGTPEILRPGAFSWS